VIGVKDGELPCAPRLCAQPAVGMHDLAGLTLLIEREDAIDLVSDARSFRKLRLGSRALGAGGAQK
jgi:hypothetical protein